MEYEDGRIDALKALQRRIRRMKCRTSNPDERRAFSLVANEIRDMLDS